MKLTTRLLALLLALCMVFAFAACGKDPANPDPVDPSNPAGPVDPANPDDPTQPTKEEQHHPTRPGSITPARHRLH